MKDYQLIRAGKGFNEEKMHEIAWRIFLNTGLRVAPGDLNREIGNMVKRSGIPEVEMKEFAKALIDAEWDTKFGSNLTEKRRNEIAFICIKSKKRVDSEKLKPAEALRFRCELADRLRVSRPAFSLFTSTIMKELYGEVLEKK